MHPFRLNRALFLVPLLLLASCMPGASEPTPTTVPSSAAVRPTEALRPTEATTPERSAGTSGAALPTPNLPTATAIVSEEAQPGRFVSAEHGLSVLYPEDWERQTDDTGSSLVWLTNPRDGFVVGLFIGTFTPDTSLEEAAQQTRSEILTGLDQVKEQRVTARTLDDGREAWVGEYDAQLNGNPTTVIVATTGRDERLVSAVVFGQPEGVIAGSSEIDAVIGSIALAERSVFGLPRNETLVLSGGESTNPRDYDPAVGSGDELVFSGLVSFNPQLELVPELAESWQVSDDGRIYTFTLRSNARFHDGKPVTAEDVVYSWERALDPATDSNAALTYLGDIVGAEEHHQGMATGIEGLSAIDAHTLEVTILGARPYFLMKLTAGPALVVDRANVESGPEWYRTPNGSGPYRLMRWEPFKVQMYERNEDYYLGSVPIRYIVNQLFAGYGLRLYETDQVDMAGVGRFDVARFRDPSEPLHTQLVEEVGMCTSYIAFDVRRPPFDDVQVRRAFALAVNRQRYLDVVLQGVGVPARGLYPPGLPGFSQDLEGQRYEPEQAKQLLAASRYGGAAGLPPIVFTDSGFGSDVDGPLAALIAMWQTELGVEISVENLEPNTAFDQIHDGNHGQMFWYSWCADYPDPENFADALFHSRAQQNLGGFSSPQLDTLLEQGRTESDVARRMGLYRQAEEIITGEAAGIFLSHSLSYTLVKPSIQGYVSVPISGVPLIRYLSINP